MFDWKDRPGVSDAGPVHLFYEETDYELDQAGYPHHS